MKYYKPIVACNLTSPMISFLDPSKALTMVKLDLMLDGLTLKRYNVAKGHTLSDDPLSIRSREMILSLHLATMNEALVCCPFVSSNSSNEKEICSIVKMALMICPKASSEMASGTFIF